MTKTLYEGYRVGKRGVERWVGTTEVRDKQGSDTTRSGSALTQKPSAVSPPKAGSALHNIPKKS